MGRQLKFEHFDFVFMSDRYILKRYVETLEKVIKILQYFNVKNLFLYIDQLIIEIVYFIEKLLISD